MNSSDIAQVAHVIELIEKNPPSGELWDSAHRHGPPLAERVRLWLKERM